MFDAGSVIAHIKADTSNFQNGLKEAQKSLGGFKDNLGNFGKELTLTGAKLSLFAVPVGLFFKDASKAAADLEKNLITLDIIAGRFGVSGQQATDAAQALGKELRIGVGASAAGLQNLLKSGLNLEQSIDLMKRFTNEAMTGKSNSISLATAVENLSFAYATNNSAIGNLSGINENFVNIIEKGRQALLAEGVAASTITEEMAKYRGMIEVTNLTMGSSARFLGTTIDKQAEMEQQITDLKVAFGTFINEALVPLMDILIKVLGWLNSLNESQKMIIVTIGAFVLVVGPLLTILGLLASGISALITVGTVLGTLLTFLAANPIILIIAAIVALIAAGIWLVKNWDQVKAAATVLGDWIGGVWESLVQVIKSAAGTLFKAMISPFEDAWNRIRDLMNKIKDALDFTKRHSPSVIDIVNNGVNLVNKAFEGLPGMGAVAPHMGMQMAGVGAGSGGGMTNVNLSISLDGAIISDDLGAQRMAENVGNLIVKKLQGNLRF